jgi:hypothetical protein
MKYSSSSVFLVLMLALFAKVSFVQFPPSVDMSIEVDVPLLAMPLEKYNICTKRAGSIASTRLQLQRQLSSDGSPHEACAVGESISHL